MTADSGPQSDLAIEALEQNLWDLWRRFGLGQGCRLYEVESVTRFDTPIPILPYNAVLRFAVASDDIDTQIDAIFDHYRRRDVPFVWFVHPSARPLDLDVRLQARGFAELEAVTGMSMELQDLPEPSTLLEGIEIEEVTDASGVERYLELVSWRWEVPAEALPRLAAVTSAFELGRPGTSVRSWIARQQGLPVGKVLLNLSGGVAGVYGVATKPEARGKGIARTLTLEALHAARRAGYQRAVLHSTPMARSLYEKLGFQKQAIFRIYGPPNSLHL